MPTHPEQFQKNRLPWSRWKHAILLEYLKAMSAILRSWNEIYYVDGFAGPGRYKEDGIDGSPRLAAQHAKTLASSAAGYSLQCINVESDPEVFQNLEISTSEFSDHTVNLRGEFGQFVPEILRIVGNQPTLFFLDPIGVKGLEWSSLLPVFSRKSTTEILVRFDAQTATRRTGNDAALHKTFNSILGEDNSQYWQRYVSDEALYPIDRKTRLTMAYEDKLQQHFEFVARIPIRSSDDHLKYYLLFATRNVKGVQVMNDVFYNMRDLRDRTLDEERDALPITQLSMFDSTPEEKEKEFYELEFLKSAVLIAMESGESFTRDVLRGHVASEADNFGRFSASQFTAVLGGKPRGMNVPSEFENLKARIQISNRLTLATIRRRFRSFPDKNALS